MAHPFCAPAHLPAPDPFELAVQAAREIKAVRAAYNVIECIQRISDASEARELMLLTDAQFQQRVERAMATLHSMRQARPC